MKSMTKEHIPTLFFQIIYSMCNARNSELIDPHRGLMKYIDCKLNAKGNSPYLKTLIKVFCKVCKKRPRDQEAIDEKKKKVALLAFQEPRY
jgi:hypothetical protein